MMDCRELTEVSPEVAGRRLIDESGHLLFAGCRASRQTSNHLEARAKVNTHRAERRTTRKRVIR